jgi:hypothetical protein
MQTVTLIFLFVALVVLGGVAIWLVRRFANSRLGANTNRGRLPRLAVIDAASVDGRRRLVLIRRDNVEHLLMIGGPTDIVVEPNIIRAAARGDQLPQRPASAEPPPRIALPEAGWAADSEGARTNGFDHPEHTPEPPLRPARPSFADEVRRTASALSERRGDPLTGFSPESLGGRAEPRAEPPRMEPRNEPTPPRMPRSEPLIPRPPRQTEPSKAPPVRAAERAAAPPPPPPPPPSPPPAQAADQNLAEMAQRLEAALRRPAGTPGEAPPVAPEPPPSRTARGEPPVAPPAPAQSPKSSFENLEEEMASLLGRPKSSSS